MNFFIENNRMCDTYDVAGVTLTNMKLEQSSMREVASGIFRVQVPVTALAQLLASQTEAERTH
jgi:hypothetical protein